MTDKQIRTSTGGPRMTRRPSPTALRLAKIPQVQRLSEHTEIFAAPDFFLPAFCDEVIAHSEANLRPSTLADDNGDRAFRTSTTSDLPDTLPAVAHGRQAVSRLLGLPLSHAEPLQAQRYTVGQEFKPHFDWFRPDAPDYERWCGVAGQRTWTAMAYLNTVEEGGETLFRILALR